jgi:hypothetical protein
VDPSGPAILRHRGVHRECTAVQRRGLRPASVPIRIVVMREAALCPDFDGTVAA